MLGMLPDLRHQVVVVGFGDLAAIELARTPVRMSSGKSLTNTLPSISGACIAVRPSQQQVGFLGGAFEHQIEFLSDQRFLSSSC